MVSRLPPGVQVFIFQLLPDKSLVSLSLSSLTTWRHNEEAWSQYALNRWGHEFWRRACRRSVAASRPEPLWSMEVARILRYEDCAQINPTVEQYLTIFDALDVTAAPVTDEEADQYERNKQQIMSYIPRALLD